MNIFKIYPRGVWALSSIEMWERFSFYTMQSILVLYAAAKVSHGGLGWTDAEAMRLTGFYGAAVYVSPVFGGYIADRIIGRKNSILFGSIIMMFGHLTLAFPGIIQLYLGLALLIVGCGLMKPAISAIVGEFYDNKEEGHAIDKESGFAIFYMAINIGGFIGPMISGVVMEKSFSLAFGTAALGLVVAIANYFMCKNKSLKGYGETPTKFSEEKVGKWSSNDYKKFWTYFTLCVSNIFWNIIYALPYGLLTLYADHNIGRHLGHWEIPATWFYGAYSVIIIIAAPLVAEFYQLVGRAFKSDFTLSYKLATGYVLLAIACFCLLPLVSKIATNPNYVGNAEYLILFYLFFAISELITVPVLLSAATTFAPKGLSSTFISMNMMISWAIGAWLGGEFGALTQSLNPCTMFEWVIAFCVVFMILHILSNRFIEKIMKLS